MVALTTLQGLLERKAFVLISLMPAASTTGLILAAVLLLGIGFAIGRNDEKKTVLVAPPNRLRQD